MIDQALVSPMAALRIIARTMTQSLQNRTETALRFISGGAAVTEGV
ncbi:MAG: hypothetical protein LBU21_03255 [Treponema sp.]|nr:hypothetical protein [Treponema sp.]